MLRHFRPGVNEAVILVFRPCNVELISSFVSHEGLSLCLRIDYALSFRVKTQRAQSAFSKDGTAT